MTQGDFFNWVKMIQLVGTFAQQGVRLYKRLYKRVKDTRAPERTTWPSTHYQYRMPSLLCQLPDEPAVGTTTKPLTITESRG